VSIIYRKLSIGINFMLIYKELLVLWKKCLCFQNMNSAEM
jgi:hypothetical protein